MKASAEKSSSTVSRTTASRPFFAKAGGGDFFAPVNRAAVPAVQAKMTVGKTGDKFEREADKMADKVMRMPSPASSAKEEKIQRKTDERLQKAAKPEEKIQKAPAGDKMMDKVMRMPSPASSAKEEKIQRKTDERLQKAAKPEEKIQKKEKQEEKIQKAPAGDEKLRRKGEGTPAVTPNVQAAIRSRTAGGGQPLSADVRRDMEGRFNADFSQVRVHNDAEAGRLSNQLSAKAFTHRNHIFFSRNQYQPGTSGGKQLLAHELTHTIQQGHAVQRSPQVSTTVTPPLIQRSRWRNALSSALDTVGDAIGDILPSMDTLARLANDIPGFTLLTVVIGRNPINQQIVERSALNILHGFMALIPGGNRLFGVLESYGVVQRIANWISTETAALGLSYETVRSSVEALLRTALTDPMGALGRAEAMFISLINRLRSLADRLISQAITWLKETFAQPLSNFCNEVPGYGLIKIMIGRDPFTNASAPATPINVMRGVAEFIPEGTEKVNQLVQSGALTRAHAWFMQETRSRNLTWARVSGTFAAAWAALTLEKVLTPVETLRQLVDIFRSLFNDLVSFAGAALMKLLELIYEAAMGAGGARILAILKRGRDTFMTIIRNPVQFLRHLLGAVGQGVRQFSTNILRHLQAGVIAWLTGPVAQAGIQMPEQWDLRGIIWFVLQILGLTWDRVRQKLVRLMGAPAVAALESGFQLIQDIRERGLVQALRERVTEFFGNLREQALNAIRSFIQQRLVQAGIQQLLSMLTPAGAVIQAIIKTFTTVQFFIQRINQILDLVESVVNSISAIASGSIAAAANFIERTMARTIPVILDFLARFIGLGDVGAQVQRVIQGLQARVDGMLDRAVDWIRRQAANLVSRVLGGNPNAPAAERVANGLREAVPVVNRYAGRRVGAAILRPLLLPIKLRYRLSRLDVIPQGNVWAVEAAGSAGATDPTTAMVPNDNCRIGVHPVTGPPGVSNGESHHVPVKMLKSVIARLMEHVLPPIQTQRLRIEVQRLKNEAEANTEGNNLSAIWLSREMHDQVHSINIVPQDELPAIDTEAGRRRARSEILTKEARPGQRSTAILPQTSTGLFTLSPRVGTMTSIAREAAGEAAGSNPAATESDDRQYLRRVQTVIDRLFQGVLNAGITALSRLNLQPSSNSWRASLRSIARRTWERYLRLIR